MPTPTSTIPIDKTIEPKSDLKSLGRALLRDKKMLFLIIPIALILIGLLSWGFMFFKNNYLGGRKEDLKPFTGINYNVPYILTVIASDKDRIEISNNDNVYYDRIEYEINNGQLKISNIPKISVSKRGAPEILIYAKSLNGITNSERATIAVDKMTGDEIILEATDKGNIMVANIESKKLTTTVRSTGDITVKGGKTDFIEANIVNSGGKIDLQGVESPKAKTKDIGTGTIKLNANTVDESKSKDRSRK
jgi:Putative auto-transporter adhesin, head GIN domain